MGETADLATRETDHNVGRGGSYTAKRRPVQIVYAEQYSSSEEALRRERQIKRWLELAKPWEVKGRESPSHRRGRLTRHSHIRRGFWGEGHLSPRVLSTSDHLKGADHGTDQRPGTLLFELAGVLSPAKIQYLAF